MRRRALLADHSPRRPELVREERAAENRRANSVESSEYSAPNLLRQFAEHTAHAAPGISGHRVCVRRRGRREGRDGLLGGGHRMGAGEQFQAGARRARAAHQLSERVTGGSDRHRGPQAEQSALSDRLFGGGLRSAFRGRRRRPRLHAADATTGSDESRIRRACPAAAGHFHGRYFRARRIQDERDSAARVRLGGCRPSRRKPRLIGAGPVWRGAPPHTPPLSTKKKHVVLRQRPTVNFVPTAVSLSSPLAGSYLTPSTAIILYLAYFSPILSAAWNSGELRQLCSASMLSQRRMTTGPFGRLPVTCVPGPAAT